MKIRIFFFLLYDTRETIILNFSRVGLNVFFFMLTGVQFLFIFFNARVQFNGQFSTAADGHGGSGTLPDTLGQ